MLGGKNFISMTQKKKISADSVKNKGRPTRYNNEIYPNLARKFGLLLGDKDKVADALGVSRSTFYNWEKNHLDFRQALRESIIEASADIVQSLFDLAKGGIVEKRKVTRHFTNFKTNLPVTDVTEIENTMPPNYKAIEFWLRNKNQWKSADFKEQPNGNEQNFIIMPSERFK